MPPAENAPPAGSAAAPARHPDLTAREIEVLRLAAEGLTYAEMGQQLVVSRRTVDAHLRSIYSKLGVTSRSAAVRYALDHHLL
jgi:DNA-binding CsgD family transcriptional regulator